MYRAIHRNKQVEAWEMLGGDPNWFTVGYEGGILNSVHISELEFIGDDRPEIRETTKPPIGLLPKELYYEQIQSIRFKAVCSAIVRYQEAGLPIDPKWIEEYNEILENLPKAE